MFLRSHNCKMAMSLIYFCLHFTIKVKQVLVLEQVNDITLITFHSFVESNCANFFHLVGRRVAKTLAHENEKLLAQSRKIYLSRMTGWHFFSISASFLLFNIKQNKNCTSLTVISNCGASV